MEQWERDKSQGHTLSQDALSEIYRKMDAFAKAEARRKKRRRMPKGVLAKKRKRRSAVAFVANKDMSLTSQLELHVRQDSTMDQPMKPRGNTPDAESYSSGHFDGSLGGQTTNSETENVKEMEVEYRAPRSRDLPISTGMKETSGPDSKIHLTQRRHQKTGKNEPAPDLRQLTLKSATDIVAAAGEDIAHILPSGDLRPALTQVLSLQHAQPMIRGGDQPEPMHAMSNHAHHEPSTLVAQRDASTFGNVVDFRRTANSNVSGLIQNDRSDVHYLPNGRYWCFGEVLLHLTLHNEVVGDVRVGGLPKWFKSKLISLKVEHQVLVDFRLVEMGQYVALCRGRSNDLIANAYIAPFEDSEAAVAELADSLDYNNRAALWYHPDTPYVLVMYAAASNDWRFLDRGHKFPPQYKIHLALRNSMPHIEALAPKGNEEGQRILTGSGKVMTKPGSQLTRTDSGMAGISMNASDQRTPTIAEKDRTVEIACPNLGSTALSSSKALPNLDDIPRRTRPTEALISIVSGADDVPGGRILPHPHSTNLRHDGGSAESRDECASSSPESERDPNLPFEFMNLTGQAMDTVFQHQFGISYTLLTQPSVMPTSHREMLDPGRARFYLAFPLPCHGELEALRAFLSKHTLPNTICTAVESHGWDRFKTILGDNSDHIGVIIVCCPPYAGPLLTINSQFHEQYTNYSGLPGFGKLLKMVNVNVFNICLGQVLPYSDPPVHIERLFPNGTAILLTESAIMRQPEQTLAIVRWFSQMVKTKRGTWKIVLVPNVRHWLRQVAMHAGAAASWYSFSIQLRVLSS